MVQISWLALGGTAFVAALFAPRHRIAFSIARMALGLLYIAAGAVVHLVRLLGGATYSGFASSAHVPFVRNTWESLVVPNQYFFIGLLVVFEAAVGVLILGTGRLPRTGLWAALLMHVGLLAFGSIITIWSAFLLVTLALLLRAERDWPSSRAETATPAGSLLGSRTAR